MGRVLRDRVVFAALAVLGAVALGLSYTLEPTPYRYQTLPSGLRVRIDGAMHAVDYLIIALRVGGAVAFVAGAYLTYRRFRPDRIHESEAVGGHTYDRYEDIAPEAGNPAVRSGVG